jgi:hypothetical protein
MNACLVHVATRGRGFKLGAEAWAWRARAPFAARAQGETLVSRRAADEASRLARPA